MIREADDHGLRIATGAEKAIRESIAAFEGIIAANPKPALRRRLAEAYSDLAQVQKCAGKADEALPRL